LLPAPLTIHPSILESLHQTHALILTSGSLPTLPSSLWLGYLL